MSSLFQKARLITLSNLHTILDKTIDLNSIGAVEQHCRDLEDARKSLQGELAEQKYTLDSAKKNLTSHTSKRDELLKSIRTLGSTHPSVSALAQEVVRLKDQIESDTKDISAGEENYTKLEMSVNRVLAAENQMKEQVGKLKATKATSEAQNRATAAVEAAGKAVSAAGSIDNIADKINRDAARSNAAFDNALSELPDPNNQANSARADALLAEIFGDKSSAA